MLYYIYNKFEIKKGGNKMNSIRNIRQRLNLTQEELADKLGFTRSYICLLEAGKRNVSRYVIQRIKDAMPEIDANIFF